MNVKKIDLILENSYNNSLYNLNGLMQESSNIEFIAAQRFITESVLNLRTLLIEENIVQNVRDNLLGYATAAGLGAGGMYLYNKPELMTQAQDILLNKPAQVVVNPNTDAALVAESTQLAELTQKEIRLNVFEESIVEVLPLVMENTGESLKSKLIARTILKNESINFEEADYLCNLVDQVLTEAIDEFIPDEINVEDIQDFSGDDSIESMELFDADGNKYIYDNGILTPAGVDGIDAPQIDDIDPAAIADADTPNVDVDADTPNVDVDADTPNVDVDVDTPNVDVDDDTPNVDVDADNDDKVKKDKKVEESINIQKNQLLTESSNIVARILAQMTK